MQFRNPISHIPNMMKNGTCYYFYATGIIMQSWCDDFEKSSTIVSQYTRISYLPTAVSCLMAMLA